MSVVLGSKYMYDGRKKKVFMGQRPFPILTYTFNPTLKGSQQDSSGFLQ